MKFSIHIKQNEKILSKIKNKSLINKNLQKLLISIGVEDLVKKENFYYTEGITLEEFKKIINENKKGKQTKDIDFVFGNLKDNFLSVTYCKRLIGKSNFDQNEFVDFLLNNYYENFIDLTKELELSEENIKKYINKNENIDLSELIKYQKNIDFLFNTEDLFNKNLKKYISVLSLKKNLSLEFVKKIIKNIDLKDFINYNGFYIYMPLDKEIIDLCLSKDGNYSTRVLTEIIEKNPNLNEECIKYIIEKYTTNREEKINFLNKNNLNLNLSKDFLIENLEDINEIKIISSLKKNEKDLKEVLELKLKLKGKENNNTIDKNKIYQSLIDDTCFDLDFYSQILKLNGENLEQLELNFLNEKTSNRNWKKVLNKLDKYKDNYKMQKFILSNIPPLDYIVVPEFVLEKYFNLFLEKNVTNNQFYKDENYEEGYLNGFKILETQFIPEKYKSDLDFLKSFNKKDISNYLKYQNLTTKDYDFFYDNVLKSKFDEYDLDYFYLNLVTNKNYLLQLNKEDFYKLLKNIYDINKKVSSNKNQIKNKDYGFINYIHSRFIEENELNYKRIKKNKENDYGMSI